MKWKAFPMHRPFKIQERFESAVTCEPLEISIMRILIRSKGATADLACIWVRYSLTHNSTCKTPYRKTEDEIKIGMTVCLYTSSYE
jgi:hypothetical protein